MDELLTVDVEKLQEDATLLMWAFANAAGDDAKVDAVSVEWLNRIGPDDFGLVAAGALALTARHITGPFLEFAERQGWADLRGFIREGFANALVTL